MAQGIDNFLYEINTDGSVANFKFWDADDVTNVAEVAVSAKEFPEGVTQADSREVVDYAYGLVGSEMNKKRADRAVKLAHEAAEAQAQADKDEKASQLEIAKAAQHNVTAPLTTEVREDGVTQNVFSSTLDSEPAKNDKKK
jgi:hypothetical protein